MIVVESRLQYWRCGALRKSSSSCEAVEFGMVAQDRSRLRSCRLGCKPCIARKQMERMR